MKDEKAEFDELEYRYLSTRAAKAGARKAPAPVEPKPEIHVHVDMPEAKEAPIVQSPRRWKFTHKYDRNNRLTETIATAE